MDYFNQTRVQVLISLSDNQDDHQMAATYQFVRVDTLTKSLITQFLPNFIYGLVSSNYCSCLNMGLSDE